MIGSWSNRIIEESRCHMRDRHALDRSKRDINYVVLELAPIPIPATGTFTLS